MATKLDYPNPARRPDVWVELPDEFRLEHQTRFEHALDENKGLGRLGSEALACLAICDKVNIPGWDRANPELLPTDIMGWLRAQVLTKYVLSFDFAPNARKQASTTPKE